MLSAALCAVVMQSPLTFMSYNVRYATAEDGPNSWVFRRAAVFALINSRRPDVLGVQEALATQIDELLVHLPGYSYVGVGRDDGKREGEYSAVFYRRDRLSVLESGTFWLSDTPDVVGSKSWGNNVVRICTWAKLRATEGLTFTVYNTHFDHESQPSREKSAELILTRQWQVKDRTVLIGDFNAGLENKAVRIIDEGGNFHALPTFGPHTVDGGTFNGFNANATTGERIDHIFLGGKWNVIASGIDRTLFDGRAPSDHWPVWAVVEPD